MRNFILLLIILFWYPAVSFAEMMVVVHNKNSLTYELSPSNYDNSPSNYDNSPSNYTNTSGKNRLYNKNREIVGYSVYSQSGILNIFSTSGVRLGYVPKGNKTQSIFSSTSSIWCGTLAILNGRTVIALTKSFYYRLLSNQ